MHAADRFRAQCRWLRRATLFVLVMLALVYLLGAAGMPWVVRSAPDRDPLTLGLLRLVFALPAMGYLWALWAVQDALGRLAAGELFHATVVRALRRIGAGVLAGALLSVVGVTNLGRWITGGEGSYLYFDPSGIVLGVVGAALILLARVVEQAGRLQAELDEIL
jgi:hypothetical protein